MSSLSIDEINRLKEENKEDKEIIAELKAENERLRDIIKSISQPVLLPDVPIEVTNKYKQTLQEIKAIADAPKPFIDFSVIKTATEVGYDYATICNELELRLHKVLELITKAEEE